MKIRLLESREHIFKIASADGSRFVKDTGNSDLNFRRPRKYPWDF